MSRHSLLWAVPLCAVLAGSVNAASLCGTVQDQQTNGGVAGALVIVRTTSGSYTGLHGATDESGAFCIDGIAAGTYDLEVRVDDYQVAYLRGVVVVSTTDVEIPATGVDLRLLRPQPNPARETAQLQWTLPRATRTQIRIADVHGRLVRGWSASLAAGAHSLTWNLRDGAGRRVPAGTYFVHLEADGVRRTRSITCIP